MHILPLSAQEIENRLKNLPENAVVHEYSATSQYPVSGIAVAQALASLYTHYVGTEIDAENINGATYITPNFKVNDIYINTEEKCMYQCISSEALNDGSGAYTSIWRVVSPVVDQVFNENSENAISNKAVAEAISGITFDVDQTYDSDSENAQSGIAVAEAINDKTVYTNPEPLLNDVGGIKASAHANGFDNVSVTDLITELLYPYTKPVINSFTLSPGAGVKKKGVPITLSSASANITKKSKAISAIDLYRGSTLLKSITDVDILSYGTTVSFSNINDTLDGTTNTTYTVKISEKNGTANVASTSAAYTFVDPYYQGVINKDAVIDEALLKSLTEKVEAKGTKNYTYTTTATQCALIAYPASYGNLASIKDPNGFTQTWTRYTVTANNVSYYVYISSPAAATNCKYAFSY